MPHATPTPATAEPLHTVNWWRRGLARLWLFVFGWKVVGTPPGAKLVLVSAPHTSNWDLPFTLAAAWRLGLDVHWMGKDTLFRPPFGFLLRWLGGIPVDRSAPRGVVGQLSQRFARSEKLVLAVPPSATRSRAPYWRSGFYWIAHEAGVPVVLAFLDYRKKVGGLGPSFVPSGDIRADMDRLRAFYDGIDGKHPDKAAPIRLREEMEETEGGASGEGAENAADRDRPPITTSKE